MSDKSFKAWGENGNTVPIDQPGTVVKPSVNIFQKALSFTKGPATSSLYGVARQATAVNCATKKLKEFQKRPKYKLYAALPFFLILFITIFAILIHCKGTNAIRIEETTKELDSANKTVDELAIILSTSDTDKAKKDLEYAKKLSNDINEQKNNCIYKENIFDKSIDLCNGLVASIGMIYIGSASIRFYQLRKDVEKMEPNSCKDGETCKDGKSCNNE